MAINPEIQLVLSLSTSLSLSVDNTKYISCGTNGKSVWVQKSHGDEC